MQELKHHSKNLFSVYQNMFDTTQIIPNEQSI